MKRAAPYPALAGTALFSILLVRVAPRHSAMAVGFVAAATALCAVVSLLEARRPRLRARHVIAVIVVVFGIAIATPPRSSNDLWSYTMYGRIVAQHDANPYDKLPADFRSDPFFPRVSPVWRHRGSVFGPVWVGVSAGESALTGDSPLENRLAFQVAAGLAVAAILILVWRRTRSPAALAWLGLHPVVVVAVNGGHNDVWLGLGALVTGLLVARRRVFAAGIVLGAIALVKLTALLALGGLVLWLLHRREARRIAGLVVTTAAVVIIGYAPFAADAAHVLGEADHTVTAGSVWNPIGELLVGHDAGRGLANPLAPNSTLDAIFWASFVLVLGLAAFGAWRRRGRATPVPAVASAAGAYPVAAQYTLPWYTVWALPSFTERRPSRLAWVFWLDAALLLAAWKLPVHASGSVLDNIFRGLLSYVAPLAFLVAFVVVTAREREDAEEPGSAAHGPGDSNAHVARAAASRRNTNTRTQTRAPAGSGPDGTLRM